LNDTLKDTLNKRTEKMALYYRRFEDKCLFEGKIGKISCNILVPWLNCINELAWILVND
jgi:hypothetical protein